MMQRPDPPFTDDEGRLPWEPGYSGDLKAVLEELKKTEELVEECGLMDPPAPFVSEG
jgi:hypothetical protein